MNFSEDLLPGVRVIALKRFGDARGEFLKTYAQNVFETHGAQTDWREEFYSSSHRGVIRGLHFQLPPHDHAKLVHCAVGAVLDVLVDLRSGPGYGRVASILLDAAEPMQLLIPSGIAHGFKSLQDGSLMIYRTSTEHAPSHDAGIRWNSIDFDWGPDTPIVSARDSAHPAFADFSSPF